ncbi:unnamed protein product [Thelazia callipaeda]|uniref:Uncharacterized protein n=1 Tax=Thelazia callipaeda TaxID=103827 RepID=A0A0N5CSW7_THECL|nr:unnamed protein product [Thelazia callipaeda]
MKRLESSREVSKLSREDASTQVAMWRSLVAIFRLKLKLLEDQNKNELQKRR